MAVEFTFECPLPSGLHARPASHLAEVARRFDVDCLLTNLRSGASADLKSVLAIIGADIFGRGILAWCVPEARRPSLRFVTS